MKKKFLYFISVIFIIEVDKFFCSVVDKMIIRNLRRYFVNFKEWYKFKVCYVSLFLNILYFVVLIFCFLVYYYLG